MCASIGKPKYRGVKEKVGGFMGYSKGLGDTTVIRVNKWSEEYPNVLLASLHKLSVPNTAKIYFHCEAPSAHCVLTYRFLPVCHICILCK